MTAGPLCSAQLRGRSCSGRRRNPCRGCHLQFSWTDFLLWPSSCTVVHGDGEAGGGRPDEILGGRTRRRLGWSFLNNNSCVGRSRLSLTAIVALPGSFAGGLVVYAVRGSCCNALPSCTSRRQPGDSALRQRRPESRRPWSPSPAAAPPCTPSCSSWLPAILCRAERGRRGRVVAAAGGRCAHRRLTAVPGRADGPGVSCGSWSKKKNGKRVGGWDSKGKDRQVGRHTVTR